jgi:hypothetical protein
MLIPKYKFKITPLDAAPFTCSFTIFKAQVSNDRKLVEYKSVFKESAALSFARELEADLRDTVIEVDDGARTTKGKGCP